MSAELSGVSLMDGPELAGVGRGGRSSTIGVSALPSSEVLRVRDLMLGEDLVWRFLRTLGLDFSFVKLRGSESWLVGRIKATTDVCTSLLLPPRKNLVQVQVIKRIKDLL